MSLALKSLLIFTLVCSTRARADEKVFSGPQPGEKLTPFKVLQVTGKQADKEIGILDTSKGGPIFVVFVHKITEPTLGLMIPLTWYTKKFDRLDSHYVFLTADRAKTQRQVKRFAGRFFSGSSASISLDGAEGPGKYGLNRKVALTVLVAKDNKVVANFALLDPNRNDAPKILAEVAKVMGNPAPSIEKIRGEIQAERNRQRRERRRQNPVFKLAGNENLGELMLRMVYREGNTAAYVEEASKPIVKWAGDDAKKKAALAKYAKALLDGEFRFIDVVRKKLKELSEIK